MFGNGKFWQEHACLCLWGRAACHVARCSFVVVLAACLLKGHIVLRVCSTHHRVWIDWPSPSPAPPPPPSPPVKPGPCAVERLPDNTCWALILSYQVRSTSMSGCLGMWQVHLAECAVQSTTCSSQRRCGTAVPSKQSFGMQVPCRPDLPVTAVVLASPMLKIAAAN